MHTSTESLEDNKLKLTVEVDEEEVQKESDATIVRLSREARIPGFRPGKVPRRILEARLGPKAIREEVLREVLPRYYSDAVEESELDVINVPEIDITAGEEAGPIVFDAVVELRPKVQIPGYNGLVVTIPNPTATTEDVDAQVDRMREQFATLEEVSRPAHDGDLVTLDVHGTRDGAPAEGLSADDLVYEVGTGGIVDGVDEQLNGAKAGDIFEMDAEDAPDGPAHLKVLVKQVRQKVLPDADDAFAADASEFETVAELRGDVERRIGAVKRLQATLSLRENVLEALIGLVADEPPETLVSAEAEHLLEDLAHRLSHQQMSLDSYLAAVGQEPEQLMEELRTQAVRQVRADLALRALAEAEEIEAEESDVDEEIVRLAAQQSVTPAAIRDALERSGGTARLRSQLKQSKAMSWLVDHVSLVDEEGKSMDRSALSIAELDADEAPDDTDPGALVGKA
jgi:trigger factor